MAVDADLSAGHDDRRRAEVVARAAIGALALVFTVLGLIQAERDGPAVDEVVDLTAGLVAVEHQDLRMNPEHGIVPHLLSGAVAVVFSDPVVPVTASYRNGDWFSYTEDLVTANREAGQFDDTLFWWRVAPLMAAALTGLVLFHLAARFLGPWGGLVAGGLWLLSPYVVGLAHLSALDVWYALALTLVASSLLRAWRRRSTASIALVGLAVALALMTRHQAVVLVGVAALAVFLVGGRDRRAVRGAVLVVLVAVGSTWLTYRVIDRSAVEGEPRQRFEQLVDVASGEGVIEGLAVAAPLPIEWRAGMGYLIATSEERPAYLLGSYWEGGRAWYLAGNAVVKLPVSTFALVLLGAVGWWRAGPPRWRPVIVALGVAFGAELVVLHAQPLNLGLRLGLPLLAAGCVVAGGALRALPGRAGVVLVTTLAMVQATAFVVAHPHSLAWTPPPFSDGYRYVSDSSIDIGQANEAIAERHARRRFVAASLFEPLGTETLPGVPDVADAAPPDLVGDVAVSASVLTVQSFRELSWLRAYCPVDVVAESILVYRFDHPPDMRPGPTMPSPPCDGPLSSR